MASLSNKTVVLGEASETDSEEISLGEEGEKQTTTCLNDDELNAIDDSSQSRTGFLEDNTYRQVKPKGGLGTLLASFGPALSLIKLVNYSTNSLASSSANPYPSQTRSRQQPFKDETNIHSSSPIHRNLFQKNQQLYACLNHVLKHPFEKNTKGFQTLSQRLVNIQKTVQDLNIEVTKLKKELNSLNIEIVSIPDLTCDIGPGKSIVN